MALELNLRSTNHVGVGFAVKQPKWSDDKPQRGAAGPVAVVQNATDYGLTTGITFGEKQVLDLNTADALALGIALIQAAQR